MRLPKKFSPVARSTSCCLFLALAASCGIEPESVETGASPELASESAALSGSLNYPTKWTLVNNTRQSLTFTCTCPKPRGLVNPINMTATPVSAGLTKVFSWGSGWYNDGLGLNACSWNCSVKRGTAVAATVSFNTDWGENITLRAKSTGGLVVER